MKSAFESLGISGCCLTPLKICVLRRETSARTVHLNSQDSIMSVESIVRSLTLV